MKQEIIGSVVRKCRIGKGITQETLCEGVCSISTLSRIENGDQYPSRKVFTLLVEKMGEEGILYDDYMGDYDYEVFNLSRMTINYLERNEISKAEICMDKLRYITREGKDFDNKEKCIYKFIELLFASTELALHSKRDEDVELVQYGYYLCKEVGKLLDICIKSRIKGDKATFDRIEVRMYNLIGIGKFLQKDYKNAIDIWVSLINGYKDKGSDGIIYPKEMASLYCNISAALSGLDMYDEAEIFAEKGLRYCFEGGGLRLVNRLLWNRMYCLSQKGNVNKAYIDLALSKAICNCIKKDVLKGEKLKKLPNTPYLIQLF